MSTFNPSRQDILEAFIRFRKTSGSWNEDYESRFRRFDRYCSQNYPEASGIVQEMIDGWCQRFPKETNNSHRTRIYIIIDLVKYLNARGQASLIPPPVPRQEHCASLPHPVGEKELENFFRACDRLEPRGKSVQERCKVMVFPVFFRLLYSSGMRAREARMLLAGDVDLEHGVIGIRFSKGSGQHYVVLHDSMLALMRRYDAAVKTLCPGRKYFFPAGNDGHFHKRTISKYFRRFWDAENSSHAVVYDLRHNYAIENINAWTGAGTDFYDRLTYLSKSMGHSMLESTKYYYSLVPGLSDILKERTETGFNGMLPEVCHEESKE